MVKIIPAIIAKDFRELQTKIKRVELYVDWVQLDIMDGRFVTNTTWHNPADLKNLKTSLNLEAHLMIKEPERTIDNWINSGVQRIIFHYEATNQKELIIKKIQQSGLEAGIALNPETPIEVIEDFIEQLDLILIMTVEPGQGGQRFLETTLEKISALRKKYKNVNIEVDGGINKEVAPSVIKAGANFLASGTAIFESDNIQQTIEELKLGQNNTETGLEKQ